MPTVHDSSRLPVTGLKDVTIGALLWIRQSFLRFTLSTSAVLAAAAVGFELAGHGVNAALTGITAIFVFLYAFAGFVVLRLIGYSA